MKLILREKKKKLTEAEAFTKSKDFRVIVDPQVILDLTPPEETIPARAKSIGKFSQRQADLGGGIYLGIDPKSGEVIEHGGRARSQAAINSGEATVLANVRIPHEAAAVSWDELPSIFKQQEGGANRVPKSVFEYIPETDEIKDILEIGNNTVTYETQIIPKGHVWPSGKINQEDYVVKDGVKDSLFELKKIYHKLYKIMRKQRGWGEYEMHHDEVADETEKNIKDNYVIEDQEGELQVKMARGGWYKPEYNRKAVPPIQIRTK